MEFAACIEQALMELQLHYDAILTTMQEQIDLLNEKLEKAQEELEKTQDEVEKVANPKKPVEIEANVKLNKKSVQDLKKQIMNLLRW